MPVSRGGAGAVAAAHPAAVAAGLEVLEQGGGAVDAAVAAQAVLAVVLPDACGVGGDALVLVRDPTGSTTAVNGAGAAGGRAVSAAADGGAAVTVPGLVGAWAALSEGWGRLPLADALRPAVRLAAEGAVVLPAVAAAVREQHPRLLRGGAGAWPVLSAAAGDRVVQPRLAGLLARIGDHGPDAFYRDTAAAVAAAVRRDGGLLDEDDLAAHRTWTGPPVSTAWRGGTAHVQPPSAQGVLLAMALAWLEREGLPAEDVVDHVAVEVTEAAFAFRDEVVKRGAALLDEHLEVDRVRAAGRGGPRAYLHTAGVAAADAGGTVVSSLVSVFDDFGSGTFVPEGGFVLNNRAGGFTGGDNAFAPGRRPVHTLAPALLDGPDGVVALATPGADGQVQTLLQVLLRQARGASWSEALAAPRWRSEGGRLLVQEGHPAAERLAAAGHGLVPLDAGDPRFGAVVGAGLGADGVFAVADGRRSTATGAR